MTFIKSYIEFKKFIKSFKFLLGNKIKNFYLIITLYFFISLLDLLNISLLFAFSVAIFENKNLSLLNFLDINLSKIIQNNVEISIIFIFLAFLNRSFFYVFLNKKIINIKFDLNVYLTQRLISQFFKKKNAETLNTYKSSIFFESIINWTSAFHEKVFAVITKFIGEFIILINILIFSSVIINIYILFFVIAITLIYFTLYTFFISKFFFDLSFKIKNVSLGMVQFTKDMFSNFNIINDLNLSEFMTENFKNLRIRFFGYHIQQEIRNIQIKVFVELFYIVLFCLFVFYIFKMNGVEDFSKYIFLFYGIYRSKPLIDIFSVAKSRTLSSLGQVENLSNILYELEIINKEELKLKKIKFNKSLLFKNINLQIEKKQIFKNAELRISKGKKIIITGQSGSGKTTLAKCLNGSFKIKDLDLRVDDKKYNGELNFSTFYLPQNTFILEGGLKKNILFNENIFDEKKYNECLKLSYLDNEILTKNINLSFENQLSQGEKQRIGIARAFFYNNFDIYIFDESTSGLDKETENNIIKNIIRKFNDKTVIFITHNLYLIENFDEHYKIENSKISKTLINEKKN